MDLISPEEFKKNRKSGAIKLTPPAESKQSGGSSLNLISPDEFKSSHAKVEPVQPVADPAVVNQIRMAPMNLMNNFKQAWPTTQVPTQQPAPSVQPAAPDQLAERPPYLQRVREATKGFPDILEPLAFPLMAIAEAPAVRAIGEALGTVKPEDEGYKPVSGAGKITGQAIAAIGTPLTVPGAGLGGGAIYNQAGSVLAKYAPKLGTSAGGRVAETAIKSVAEGVPLGVGTELALNPEASGKELVLAAGLGGVGSVVIGAAGKGIGEGIQALRSRNAKQMAQEILEGATGRKLNPAAHPEERIVQEVPASPDVAKGDAYAANLNRFDDIQKQFNEAIDAQYDLLRKQRNGREGVDQGAIIRDPSTGEVVDRVGRISNNPRWYQEFYDSHGRVPTNKDIRALAEEHVRSGYADDTGTIPPWRPRVIEDIDDELASIRGMVNQVDPAERAGLERVASTLADSRAQIRRQMPEGVSALRTLGDVQAMANKTAAGRPLLPRVTGDVGESVREDVTGRADIIASLSKELGIPIRTGRYRQQAHGIFKVKSGVVRSKLTNDLPVISHEVGHALDKRYKLSSSAYDSELLALGQNTSGKGYTQDQVRDEGVAEFFRLMLTDPEAAARQAPNFHQQFIQKVKPKDKTALLKAQVQIRKYIDQDILTKSFSEMSVGKRDKRKLPSLSNLYTKFVDDLNPIKQALKPLGEKGRQIFENFWLLRGASGRAQAFLRQGVVDAAYNRIGKSYDEILNPVKKNLNEFRAYIKDMRALELADRNIMTGSDLEPSERLRATKQMEQLHPEFKQAHQDLKDYQDALLDELIESGVLSADDVHAFKELNKEYVPFFRVFEAEAGSGAAKGGRTNTGSGAADQSSPIRRIKGSDREIVDPLESIIKNTYQYITIAERNKAMRELIDAVVNSEDLGGLIEKIPTPMQGKSFSLEELRSTLERAGADPDSLDMDTMVSIFRPANVAPGKENVVSVFRDGKRTFYQLDPDLYRAVTAADKEQMNFLVRAANMPVRMLRSGIVNTLEFWLKNMFRDQFSAMINSKNGYIPYVDLVRGMYHVLGRSDTFTKFLSAGGAQGLRQSLDRKYLQHDLRSILATSMKDKAMNVLKNPLEAMRALSEVSELGTRVGEFSKGVKKNSSIQGIKSAAVASRDLIDFGRAGTWGRDINKVSAFWNAQIQGLDKTIRVFSDPKTAPKAFAKAAAFITAPTAALYYKNKDDPRYQELPQWDKDLFWHMWIGDKHFRVPIPFELGVMFKVVPERLLGYGSGSDQPFRELGKTAWDTVDVIPDISMLTPWIEAYSNKNFMGAPIVPRREQDLLPEDQAGPYTSGAAKLVARIPGVNDNFVTKDVLGSPRKVDHIVKGYTGSLGKYATQLIDAGTNVTGVTERTPKPKSDLSDWPGFKAFMGGEFGGSTDSVDKFYDRFDKLTEQKQRSEKNGGYFEGAGELAYLNDLKKTISEISKQIRDIQTNKDMSPKEKTDEIRRLNLMSNNFARMGLGKDQLEYEDVFK